MCRFQFTDTTKSQKQDQSGYDYYRVYYDEVGNGNFELKENIHPIPVNWRVRLPDLAKNTIVICL
jgi:hypothetical protein